MFAAGIPIYSTRKLLPFLRSNLRDGGYLPTEDSALRKYHAPLVILTQQTNIRSRIFKHRLCGLIVLVDETSDTDGDCEPINILIVTSAAAYFVDTIFVDVVKDDEKYGDVFGKTFVEWWDPFFRPYHDPNTCPLQDEVWAFVTDNVNYNVGAFNTPWAPRYVNAVHVSCIAHVLSLVGSVFRDHKHMGLLRDFMAKARSLLKGKENIRRRRRLRRWLQQQVEDGDSKRPPPDWADTCWAGWFNCTLWHCSHFVLFHGWVSVEAALPNAPAPMIDFKEWLDIHSADVRLLLLFVVEHAPEVFRLLDKFQVSVASTLCGDGTTRRPKPTMHRVFNRFHTLHWTLQQVVDTKLLRPQTEKRLHPKKQNRTALYDADTMHARLLKVLGAAKDKLWKYVGKHMDLAKQARILDPTQLGALPHEIASFPLIPSTQTQRQLLENGEWKVYRDSITPSTPQFDVLQWWEGMALRLPTMYPIARSILAIPHTSCDLRAMWSDRFPF